MHIHAAGRFGRNGNCLPDITFKAQSEKKKCSFDMVLNSLWKKEKLFMLSSSHSFAICFLKSSVADVSANGKGFKPLPRDTDP